MFDDCQKPRFSSFLTDDTAAINELQKLRCFKVYKEFFYNCNEKTDTINIDEK
jgi:hypothetical protein